MNSRLAIKQAEMRRRMERQRVPKIRIEYISSNDNDDLIAEKLAKTSPFKQYAKWIGHPRIERIRNRLKLRGFRMRQRESWTIWAERL